MQFMCTIKTPVTELTPGVLRARQQERTENGFSTNYFQVETQLFPAYAHKDTRGFSYQTRNAASHKSL